MGDSHLPVWLLDVDGVINTYGGGAKPPTHVWPKDDWIVTKVSGLTVWASMTVLDFIRDVAAWKGAEIRWHTSWQNEALELADVLDLPSFPVQSAPEWGLYSDDAGGWWKVPPVERVLRDEGRSVLWTDDDAAGLSVRDRGQLQSLGIIEIISPNHRTGLCKRHLREISDVLGRLNDLAV